MNKSHLNLCLNLISNLLPCWLSPLLLKWRYFIPHRMSTLEFPPGVKCVDLFLLAVAMVKHGIRAPLNVDFL